jgi:ADP-ribose pyrophosphatase YjhB (NUDIX family)
VFRAIEVEPELAEAHLVAMPEFVRRVPEGDNRERAVCAECGFIDYQNPKVVVGSVVVVDGRVMLCRRAIEPRRGFWTLPAGYLELGETLEEGARREAEEEAQARIVPEGILAIYSISRIGQVQVIFRATLAATADEQGLPGYAPGPESLEVGLFGWEEIPWEQIAFPSVRWALQAWHGQGNRPLGAPAGNPPEDRRGEQRLAPVEAAL